MTETNSNIENYSTIGIISKDFDYLDYNSIVGFDHNYNLSATLNNIRELLNPENYSPSYKATLTRRATLIIAFYCTIVIVSLFGNLLVCYVVFKRKRMRISTNLLMTNLALSDLLMTVINIPFNIARILLDEWPFGSILCVLVPLVQVTSVYVSTLTMTIIAIDRYQAIINPLHKRITTSLPTLITILLIWITAVIFSIPNVMFNHVVEIAGHINLHRCRAIYPKPELIYRRYVTLFTFLTQYAIPLSITTFAYIRISFYIWSKLTETKINDHSDAINEVPIANRSNESVENSFPLIMPNKGINFKNNICYQANVNQLRERSRRKSIKMLALVVGVFSICWLPLNIFHLNSDFSSSNRISDPNIFFICHWFAMSSVCYNPFIYFWLNRHYRQEIKHLLRCTNVLCTSNRANSSSPVLDMVDHHRNQMKNRNFIKDDKNKNRSKNNNNDNNDNNSDNYPMVCLDNLMEKGFIKNHMTNPPRNQITKTNYGNNNTNDRNNINNNIINTDRNNSNNDKNNNNNDRNNINNNNDRNNNKTPNCKILFRSRFHNNMSLLVSLDQMNDAMDDEQPSSSHSLVRSNISNMSLYFQCDHIN